MASGGGFSYRPNVNRNVTKKWREATRPTYDDDDDWGDDGYGGYDEPPVMPQQPPPRPGWGNQMPPPSRSFTNPSPPRSQGRPSFDRGDDRRHVSAGVNFEGAYPTTQRAPFPEPQHEEPFQQQRFYAQPSLHVNTGGPGPFPGPNMRPGSRGSQRPGYSDAPFSAPPYGQQRSQSGNRPSPGGYTQRQGSPARPDSRSSNHSNRMPPRKSSLSQEQMPPPIWTGPVAHNVEQSDTQASNEPPKPLPFIRPSDIYKRMEEEKERERRSMDSSRPSLDRPSLELDTTRSRESVSTAKNVSDNKDAAAPDGDTDSTRRLRTNLDPVPERKSEYGLDNMLKATSQPATTAGSEGVQRNLTNASSVYTDRPDPVSASTDEDDGSAEPSSAFSYEPSLPAIGRQSIFNPQLESSRSQPDPMPSLQKNISIDDRAGEDHNLDHKASAGYRSVVQQAFDNSQTKGPNSPTSTNNTIPRSNSASTSELSPIITRSFNQPGQTIAAQSIPEEPASSHSARPLSDATVRGPASDTPHSAMPIAQVVQPGYRRDTTPPKSGSPARTADVRQSGGLGSQKGILAQSNATDTVAGGTERGRLPYAGSDVISPSISQASGVSEEFNKWQAQSQQFNNNLAQNETSQRASSPITRAESPPKGTVKGLAGKYESNSGRSTPISTHPADIEVSRPSQARMESFRPVLPGGWQSYTATPSVGTPQQELSNPALRMGQQRYDSTDSIPTAKAPKGTYYGSSEDPFAAAAAAGTALAGSFNGPAFSHRKADTSDDESENEWDQSSTSSKEQPDQYLVRDFAQAPSATGSNRNQHLDAESTPKAIAPVPALEKASAPSNAQDSSNRDSFPAPLKMSRSLEPGNNIRPTVQPKTSYESSLKHGDNEELQKEILKSLTPRSSNVETHANESNVDQPATVIAAARENLTPPPVVEESDDMYGGRSAQITPSVEPTRNFSSSEHQPQFSVSSIGSSPQRPFLEQRFSWEMDKQPRTQQPAISTGGRDMSSAPAADVTPTKITHTAKHSSELGRPVEQVPTNTSSRPSTARGADPVSPVGHNFANSGIEDSHKPLFSPTAVDSSQIQPFQNIMKLGNQQDRIRAFEDNYNAYNATDGGLDQWIQSMQSPEHSDIFQANGRTGKNPGSGTGPGPNKPQPQRIPSSRPLGNISGGRVMQEDGKKLMAAAGRFGGKAGVAAKGLFAKGKDKLRAASASEKGQQDKRKSFSMPTIVDEDTVNRRSSSYGPTPPQLPAQELVLSPMDETKWFGFEDDSSKTNQAVHSEQSRDHSKTELLAAEAMNASAAQRDVHVLPPASTIVGPNEDSAKAVPAVQVRQASTPAANSSIQADQGQVAGKTRDSVDFDRASQIERPVSAMTTELPHAVGVKEGHDHLQPNERLGVADNRRVSTFSAVSSASHSPAVSSQSNQETAADRSISPAVQEETRPDDVPKYEEAQPTAETKEEEASRDRAADTTQHDSLPQYEEIPAAQNRQPRIGPDAQIVPVGNLGSQQRLDPSISSRPFSFEGSEALRQAQQAYVQRQQGVDQISQPMSPVSQTASKDLSQVSTEEIPDDQTQRQNRQSRSYSRPFGAENIGQHPAFRQEPPPNTDRSQMYSSEAPLASPQRIPEQDTGYQQQQQPAQQQGYRIPGPYGQEYRSPKPKSTPSPTTQQNHRINSMPTASRQTTNPASEYEDYGEKRFPSQSTEPDVTQQQPPPTQQEQRPEPRSAKRSFGAFFRAKPKPGPSRHDSNDREDFMDQPKRPGFFSRGSRQDSIASQTSSQLESRDVVGQLPGAVGPRSRNRFSRDMSGGAVTPVQEQDDVSNKKKKRFSAMGNLFSKNDKPDRLNTPQRSTTLPSNSAQPNRGGANGQYQDPQYQQQYQNQGPAAAYQQLNTPQQQKHGPSHGQGQNFPPSQPYQSPPSAQHADPRHLDLRIDTSGHGGRQLNHPASAPPQTYAPRDISYGTDTSHQNHTYQQTASTTNTAPRPSVPTTRAPLSATSNTPTGSHSSINAHVVNLHKRSRSPASEARRRSQLAPPVPEEEQTGSLSPAGGLGTFINKKYSPVDGIARHEEEQEKPWRIGIPGADEEQQKRRARQILIEQSGRVGSPTSAGGEGNGQQQQQRTVAERMMAPSGSVSAAPVNNGAGVSNGNTAGSAGGSSVAHDRAGAVKPPPIPMMSPNRDTLGSRDGRKGGYVAELPGSKAEGYESEEEVTMSATVRPGDWSWELPVYVDDTK